MHNGPIIADVVEDRSALRYRTVFRILGAVAVDEAAVFYNQVMGGGPDTAAAGLILV